MPIILDYFQNTFFDYMCYVLKIISLHKVSYTSHPLKVQIATILKNGRDLYFTYFAQSYRTKARLTIWPSEFT